MPTSTTNYELIKPGTDDPILIEQLNTNADIIDNALKENADALGGKVDKETGKGLSTNDFTTAEKTKLDDLAEIKSIGTGLNLDSSTGELTATGGGSGGTTNYNDLSNKPQINGNTLSGNKTSAQLGLASASDIPTVPITAIQKNGTGITPVSGTVNITVPTQASDINAATATQGGKADTAIQGIKVNSSTVNPDSNKVVSITVPTTAADVSALPDTTKYAAALSLTINSSTFVMAGQLKDQNGDNLGTAQTIDLPLESVVVGGSYNSQTKKVVLNLQNGNTIEFSVADLVSGLQTELSASNKLNPAYINYDSTHRAVSDTEKSTWNGKQNAIDSSHKLSADLVDDTNATNKFATAEELEQIQTNKNNILSVADQSTKYNIAQGRARTLDSVTSTVSGYTITFSGTSSGTNSFSFLEPFSPPKSGDYVWKYTNGATMGGTPIYVYMWDATANSGVKATNIEGGFKVTLDSTHLYTMGFTLKNNKVVSGDYSVMIISKDLWDKGFTDYQPYALSNAELTAAIQAIQAQLANQ